MKMRTLLIIIVLAAAGFPLAAYGQARCTPACHPDETLRDDGYCEHDSGFPTFARSHRMNDCAPTAPVNRSTGLCTPAGGCGGGGSGLCREHPVCAPDETFRDGGCYRRCAPLAPCSHTRAICEDGWTLDIARGVCRICRFIPGGPGPALLRPDLVFAGTPTLSPALKGNSVKLGRRYAI